MFHMNNRLNPLITDFLHYNSSGSFTRKRDQIFMELFTEYKNLFASWFITLERNIGNSKFDVLKQDLEQEIATALLIRLNRPFKHDNYAATLYWFISGRIKNFVKKQSEIYRYELLLSEIGSFSGGPPLKRIIKDYKTKSGKVIPIKKVIKLWRSKKYSQREIACCLGTTIDVIAIMLKLAGEGKYTGGKCVYKR